MSWKDIIKNEKVPTFEETGAFDGSWDEDEKEKAFGKPLSYWKNLHRKSNSFPSISFNEFMMFKIAPIYKKKKKEDEDNE